jgi:2-oxoglutarate ferredoxin oxidoreductase subunit alpha
MFATNPEGFLPYLRNEKTLARPWAIPGTPGLEHRIGGLEKQDKTGNVNYEPENHEIMVRLRAEKIARIANDLPPAKVDGDDHGDVLVVGWGGTYGALRTAVESQQAKEHAVSHLHLRYINPMQTNVGEILSRFKHILVPEINLGQLIKVLRERFLVPAIGYNRVAGLPFKSSEIEQAIEDVLGGKRV